MTSTNRTATGQVDVLVLNPKNRKQLVDAFASWLDRRADVALHALAIQCAPLDAEDEENGLTPQSIAGGERTTVASAAPWCHMPDTNHEDVDATLLAWANKVKAERATVPAWCRRLREAQ